MKKNEDALYREISIIEEEMYWEQNPKEVKKLTKKKNKLQKELQQTGSLLDKEVID